MIQTQRNGKFVALRQPGDRKPAFEADSYAEVLTWSHANEAAETVQPLAAHAPSGSLFPSEEALEIIEEGDQKPRKAKSGRRGES
jgi:hypothetical protein